jgi:hypothetical protein
VKKICQGSCHCGAIRFSARIDLAPVAERETPELPGVWWTQTFRCNCSYCSKTRYWKAFVRVKDFSWIGGKESSANYQFGAREIDHYFCTVCGTQTFARSEMEQLGGEFYCVNIACLDGVAEAEFAAAPIAYEDGRNDAWDRAPTETRHL